MQLTTAVTIGHIATGFPLVLLWCLNREPVRAYFQSNEWSDGGTA